MSTWRNQLYEQYISSGTALKESESDFPARAPEAKRMIRNYLPNDRDSKIVDLGCGHGTYIHFLKQAGYERIRGVDISPEQIDRAHELGLTEAVQGDLFEYLGETSDSSVDVLLMIDIIEHLSRKRVYDLLEEARRVLRANGRCIIHTVNATGIFGMRVRYGDLTHEIAFTPSSIHQVLSVTGFQEITIDEDKPVPHGFLSSCRRITWEIGTLPHRILLRAESPGAQAVLTQNMIIQAIAP